MINWNHNQPMKQNPNNKTFTLTSGKVVTEQEVARTHGVKYTPLRKAARVMDAEDQGWTNINYNARGDLIGLSPKAKSPADLEPIP